MGDLITPGFLKRPPVSAPMPKSNPKRRRIPRVTVSAPSPMPKSDAPSPPQIRPAQPPLVTLGSDNVNDMPADYDDASDHAASPCASQRAEGQESLAPSITPAEKQWEEFGNSFIKSARESLDSHQISDGEQDDVIEGRPSAWLLYRARAFETNGREHRPPTHPKAEEISLMGSKKLRTTMQTYAGRVVRANVPLKYRNAPRGGTSSPEPHDRPVA